MRIPSIHLQLLQFHVHHVNVDAKTELIRSRGRGRGGRRRGRERRRGGGARLSKQLIKLLASLCLAKISSDGAMIHLVLAVDVN